MGTIVGSISYLWRDTLEIAWVHLLFLLLLCSAFVLHLLACVHMRPYGPAHFDFNALIVSERHGQGQRNVKLSRLSPNSIARDF